MLGVPVTPRADPQFFEALAQYGFPFLKLSTHADTSIIIELVLIAATIQAAVILITRPRQRQ